MINKLISVITPTFNEEKNLPELYLRFKKIFLDIDMEWEWIIIDDHSIDNTFTIASEMAATDTRISVIRFAKNHGSHLAIHCGLSRARGDCALAMAADLQNPPEIIPRLINSWQNGTHIVWAARNQNHDKTGLSLLGAKAFYWLMHNMVGLKKIHISHADFFLIDRKIINVFLQCDEKNNNIFILLESLGFNQQYVFYDKLPRINGKSGWTFRKKIKLAIDSIISNSYTPIRFFSAIGMTTALIGFIYAFIVGIRAMLNIASVEGWSSLIIVVLILGGLQMIMLGILGEYLWRTLDHSRKKPAYYIENEITAKQNHSLKEYT